MMQTEAQELWAVAKLVRHQALDLAFEGSNPSRPAIIPLERPQINQHRYAIRVAVPEGADA